MRLAITTWSPVFRLDYAEGQYTKGLLIRESQLGADSIEVAESLHLLAYCYLIQGRIHDAEPHIMRALRIKRTKLPKDDWHTAESAALLWAIYIATNRQKEAQILYNFVEPIWRKIYITIYSEPLILFRIM
jgi:tetratricopeptide (TPR) repeat protein